jgi:Tfp pilus assembly protein PilO
VKLKRPLPQGAVIGGIVGAGLLVALVGWLVLVSPQKHKAADLDMQRATVEAKITDQLAQIAAAKNVTAAPTIRVADVYKLAKAMPSSVDAPDILIEVNQVANDAGVDVQSINLSPPAADGTIPVTLNLSGDFFTVTDLLYRLRNLVSVRHGALEATGRLFAIDNVSLAPSGRAITATVTMHTYSYAPPAAAPPVTTPTLTDTTQTSTTPSPDTPPSSPTAAGAP